MTPKPLASLLLIPLGLLSVGGSELASLLWQPGPDVVERRGLYREVIRYTPPAIDEVDYQHLPVEHSQVGYLTHDRGRRFAFFDRTAARGMELLCLDYDGNNSRFFFDLFNHPPERCMASAGAEVSERFPDETLEVNGERYLVQRLVVTSTATGENRYIYKLTWVHSDYALSYDSSIHWKRVQAALATIPPPPALMLMGGAYGFESEKDAWAFFRRCAIEALQRTPR